MLDRARRRSHSRDVVSPRIRRVFPAQASGGQGEESLEDLAGARLRAHGACACAPVERVHACMRACVHACMRVRRRMPFVACIEQAPAGT